MTQPPPPQQQPSPQQTGQQTQWPTTPPAHQPPAVAGMAAHQQPATSAPPPQSTPQQQITVASWLRQQPRRVDAGSYLVLPLEAVAGMPPAWQQHLVSLLDAFEQHQTGARWPDRYRITPCHWRVLASCSEQQLAGLGIDIDVDEADQLVYIDRTTGETIPDPDTRQVLVPPET